MLSNHVAKLKEYNGYPKKKKKKASLSNRLLILRVAMPSRHTLGAQPRALRG
jgi:hypothetical protein